MHPVLTGERRPLFAVIYSVHDASKRGPECYFVSRI